MSEEQLKAFIEKVRTDTELLEKLKAVASTEAVMDLAKSQGFSITADDLKSLEETEDFSNEELEAAAGGSLIAGIGATILIGLVPITMQEVKSWQAKL